MASDRVDHIDLNPSHRSGDEPASRRFADETASRHLVDESINSVNEIDRTSMLERDADALAQALARLRGHDEVLAPAPGCEVGVRLQFARGPRLDCLDLPADPNHAVVLGSHEACSFRITAGEVIANRHALLIPREQQGERVLELVDLRRRHKPTCLIGGEGPSAETVLRWASPEGEPQTNDALLRIVGLGPDGARPIDVRLARAHKLDVSTLELGADAERPVDYVRTDDGEGFDPCLVHVSLFRARVQVSGWLRASALRAGVLIRREREPEPGERVAHMLSRLTARLSRAHLLLRREGEELVAYDLDSSPGSFLGAERIRRLVLPRERVRLKLGSSHSGLWLELALRPSLRADRA